MNSNKPVDVIVIGGGVIGCSIAYFLASKYKQEVVIIERDAVASGASGGAAGELGAVGRHRYPANFTKFLLDGIKMHDDYADQLISESGIDYLLSDIPMIRPAFNEEEASELQEQVVWQRELGLSVDWLDYKQVHSLSSWLSSEAIGAAYTVERQLEAYPFAIAIAQASEKNGVSIRNAEVKEILYENNRAIGVKLSNGDEIFCGTVVIANGPWSQFSQEWHDLEIPVIPLRGQIVHSAAPEGMNMPVHAIFHETGYVLPKPSGDLLIGTTQERAGFDPHPTLEAQNSIMEAVIRLAPAVIDAPIKDLTACLRPYCEDELPIIGAIPNKDSLFIATGHGYKGVTLALVTGSNVAELIIEGSSTVNLAEFSPSRFQGEA